MDFTKKISLEEISGKQYRIKTKEPENNKDAVLTHFIHNQSNGVSKYYKTDAIKYTKEILQFKYPEEKKLNIIWALP